MPLKGLLALGTAIIWIVVADASANPVTVSSSSSACSIPPACSRSLSSSCVPHVTCTLPMSCSVPSWCSFSVPVAPSTSRLAFVPVVYSTPTATSNTPLNPSSTDTPSIKPQNPGSKAPASSNGPAGSGVPTNSMNSRTADNTPSPRPSSPQPPLSPKQPRTSTESSSNTATNGQPSNGVAQTSGNGHPSSVQDTWSQPQKQTSSSTKDTTTSPGSSPSNGKNTKSVPSPPGSGILSQGDSKSPGHITSTAPGSIVSSRLPDLVLTTSESGSLTTETVSGAMVTSSVPPSTITEDAMMITTSVSGSMVTTDVMFATIDPSGSEASSSANSYSTLVGALIPVINSWVKHPEAPEATAALDAIKKTTPEGINLGKSLGGSSDGGCSNKKRRDIGARGLFDSLLDAVNGVTCGVQNIEGSISKSIDSDNPEDFVKSVENQIKDDLSPDLDSLGDLIPDEPNDPDHDPSTSPSASGTSSETSSETSSGTSTSTKTSSTSTQTSTSTSSATPIDEPCSPKCSACTNDNILPAGFRGAKLGDVSSKRDRFESEYQDADGNSTLNKRTLDRPTHENWPSWFNNKIFDDNTFKVPHGHTRPGTVTTAIMREFGKDAQSFALLDLYGCTSLILVSKYGMYISHYWQIDSFQDAEFYPPWGPNANKIKYVYPGVSQYFEGDVLQTLEHGLYLDMYNIPNVGHPFIGGIGNPIFTAEDAGTQAIIVTPSNVGAEEAMGPPGWAENIRDMENMGRLDEEDKLPKAAILYPDQVNQIANKVRQLIPNLSGGVKTRMYVNSGRRDILNHDPTTVLSKDGAHFWGKILLEYDPNSKTEEETILDTECEVDYAGVKVYLGDNVPDPILTKEWIPTDIQKGWGNPQKRESGLRQRDACQRKAYSAEPTEVSELTTGLFPLQDPPATSGTATSGTATAGTATTATGRASTPLSPTSSAMCSLEIVDSSSSICDCHSTAAKHTLSHQITKPTDKDCSDIKTFPMTSFLHVPSTATVTTPPATTKSTATSASCTPMKFDGANSTQTLCVCSGGPDYDPVANKYSLPTSGPKCTDLKTFPTSGLVHVPDGPADPQICKNHTPGDEDHKAGWCKCEKDDLVQWEPLPYIQGTATVLAGNCQAISSISFTTPTVTPPKTVTGYTAVDPMGQSSMYAEGVVQTTDYGVGPFAHTVGVGDPTEAYQPARTSTLANSDVELFPAKTIEGGTTIAAEPTIIATATAEAQCKYVTGPVNYVYIIWNVFDWTSEDQDFASLAEDFHGRLKARNCAVSTFQWKPFIKHYGPAFSFDTMELQDDCVRHAIQDVGGPDTLCSDSDWAGIKWWTDPDDIEGLVAHGAEETDPHSTYEAQVTGA